MLAVHCYLCNMFLASNTRSRYMFCHPGDLTKQVVERFASYEDLDRYKVTIEEREEYGADTSDSVTRLPVPWVCCSERRFVES